MGSCFTGVGRARGFQGYAHVITLGKGCVDKYTVTHEVMHALGFGHEHKRPDRDQYITIHKDNIEPGKYKT